MEVFLGVGITIVLILVNGYFAMSELALISARRSVLQQVIETGSKDASRKAQKAVDLAQRSDRLLATIQVAITLVGFFAAAFATASFSGDLAHWLAGFGLEWLAAAAPVLALIATTIIVSYVNLILGELLPKRIALSKAENVAMSVAGPISLFERMLSPVVSLLAVSTNALARILRIKRPEDQSQVSEDEIKYLVKEQDSLLDEEKRMITEIFDLGDTVALEIMTPRVDMVCVEEASPVFEVVEKMRESGFSRVPVIRDSPDSVVGIVLLRDLLTPLLENRLSEPITTWMREPVFVPETKDILPLLGEMQTSKMQIAIVVDEYGGTAGLVSIEDIVEEVVGDISDEYDPDNKYLARLGDDVWLVDGRLPVEDAIRVGFPLSEGEDYETIAGWLMDMLDTVPQRGESLEVDGFIFRVQSVRRNRISMIRVTRANADSADDSNVIVGSADDSSVRVDNTGDSSVAADNMDDSNVIFGRTDDSNSQPPAVES
ncbi:MAG: hemolysin family protein [Coriobacteriales bacterium]|jgi:putative hemolysin|nr:hemolysin family protein [Coriobacteriales bacterium]